MSSSNTQFKKGQTPWNKGKKASLENRKKLSLSAIQRRQVPPSRKGKKATKETIAKLKGKIPWNKETKGVMVAWNKGKKGFYHHSMESRNKISEANRGEKAYQWKGASPLYHIIRNCFKYRQWRSDVFTRDNFSCQECFSNTGGNLEAHHIKPFALIIKENKILSFDKALSCEEFWNINNGKTLCIACHKKTDTWGYKTVKLLI